MTKRERLKIEAAAREAIGRLFNCARLNDPAASFGPQGPTHEFDIYTEGIVVGGVSTSPLQTGGGKRNTGGCDRACSELLWLSLWPGPEQRVHVLTDRPLAEWLVRRYRGAAFPHPIRIYHYVRRADTLVEVGILSAPNPALNTDPQKRAPVSFSVRRRHRVGVWNEGLPKIGAQPSFEVLSREETATGLSSPDPPQVSPELSEGHRNCAHFVLTTTTLHSIPHYSSQFRYFAKLVGGMGLNEPE